MQLWVCCALLVSVAGGCLAQKPRPCRSPPLYEGSFSMVAQNGNSQALGKFSYDAMSQRIRLRVFERDGNYSMVMDTLLLYREQVLYQIDYEHKTCLKQALMGEFHPLEIPPNSTFLAQTVLGSLSAPGEGVLVNSWAGATHKDQGLYVMTYTEFGCLPVAVLFNGPTSDLVVSTYFNNVRGIEDPSVFIPPSFCENATLEAGKDDFFSVFF